MWVLLAFDNSTGDWAIIARSENRAKLQRLSWHYARPWIKWTE